MAHGSGVTGHITRGAEKDARHMHQFAEGEIHKQHAQIGQVHKEPGIDTIGHGRREAYQSHCQHLNARDVSLGKVTQQQPPCNQTNNDEERDVLITQVNIAQTLI